MIATPGYEWAAEDAAKVLRGSTSPQVVSLGQAYEIIKNNDNVVALVEVELKLDQWFEVVYVTCRNGPDSDIWREKRSFNFGGGNTRLANNMVGGILKKVNGKTCP